MFLVLKVLSEEGIGPFSLFILYVAMSESQEKNIRMSEESSGGKKGAIFVVVFPPPVVYSGLLIDQVVVTRYCCANSDCQCDNNVVNYTADNGKCNEKMGIFGEIMGYSLAGLPYGREKRE